VVSPTRDLAAPPATLILAVVVVTGGPRRRGVLVGFERIQGEALPSVRMVPSDVCRTVSATPPAAGAAAAGGLDAADP
jgi:hypothetical protein